MVKEISDPAEFASEIRGPGLVVVDYFATWCGPCRQIAPFIEQLATRYPNVKFLKVDVDKSSIGSSRGIRSMPTFQFFVKGNMVDEMKGADPRGLESKIQTHQVDTNPFQGKGFSLGESAPAPSNETSMREARLRALQGRSNTTSTTTTSNDLPTPAPKATASASVGTEMEMDDDEIAMAIALSMQDASTSTSTPATAVATNAGETSRIEQEHRDNAEAAAEQEAEDQKWDDEMIPVPVNEDLLSQLLDMGFPDVRARKGLVHGSTLEGALAWISDNEADPNIDQPYMVKRSEVTPKRVLTEEEKAQKLLEMKEKIRIRKELREKEEKEAEIKRERDRRKGGQELGELQEERDRMQRKREAELARKEKQDAAKEKQRILAEIARDKELRKKNKGVLPSVLGVDGYNPSAVQYEMDVDSTPTASTASAAAPSTSAPAAQARAPAPAPAAAVRTTGGGAATTVENPVQKVDSAIETISKYRTNGAGGQALKLLLTFVANVADNPDEPKYRAINMESNAFKTKLSQLVGPVLLLRALGFQKFEDEGKLKLEGSIDQALFNSTKAKLTQAEDTFRRMNGI